MANNEFYNGENLVDLVRHEREHISNEAFTYTIRIEGMNVWDVFILSLCSLKWKKHFQDHCSKISGSSTILGTKSHMNTSLERDYTTIDRLDEEEWNFDYILFVESEMSNK